MLKLINGKIQDYAILIDCPCVVLGGGEGRVTFPIKQGDSCIVLFNDRDIDNWYAGGQKMLPRTNRMHNFSDAIALVGIRNLQNKITDYLTSGTELKYGASTIKLENGKVTITNGSAKVELSGGTATVTATNVVVDAPLTTFTGQVAVTGAVAMASALSVAGALTVQGKDIGPNHTHSGVRSGEDSTGGVN